MKNAPLLVIASLLSLVSLNALAAPTATYSKNRLVCQIPMTASCNLCGREYEGKADYVTANVVVGRKVCWHHSMRRNK